MYNFSCILWYKCCVVFNIPPTSFLIFFYKNIFLAIYIWNKSSFSLNLVSIKVFLKWKSGLLKIIFYRFLNFFFFYLGIFFIYETEICFLHFTNFILKLKRKIAESISYTFLYFYKHCNRLFVTYNTFLQHNL